MAVRSAVVHFHRTTEPELEAWLARRLPGQRDPWLLCGDEGDVQAFVRPYRDLLIEAGPEQLLALRRALGAPPSSSLCIDLRGPVRNVEPVTRFVVELLAAHPGLALDDLSDRLWTLAELSSDRPIDGRRFLRTK